MRRKKDVFCTSGGWQVFDRILNRLVSSELLKIVVVRATLYRPGRDNQTEPPYSRMAKHFSEKEPGLPTARVFVWCLLRKVQWSSTKIRGNLKRQHEFLRLSYFLANKTLRKSGRIPSFVVPWETPAGRRGPDAPTGGDRGEGSTRDTSRSSQYYSWLNKNPRSDYLFLNFVQSWINELIHEFLILVTKSHELFLLIVTNNQE